MLRWRLLRLSPEYPHHGGRAAGKTTSARRLAADVLRLEDPAVAAAVAANPDAALRRAREPVLLDEWQEVPEVLGAVKRAVDDDPRPSRFLLTGSVEPISPSASGLVPGGSCGWCCMVSSSGRSPAR